MQTIFIDTAACLALLDTSDSLHVQARHIMRDLRQERVRLITTEWVLVEFANALSGPAFRIRVVAFVAELRQLPLLHILPLDQALLHSGWTLYSQQADKEWSLTDCISFVSMAQRQITTAFT